MEKTFQTIKLFVLAVIIFLFPFFFLPFTQEFFATSKLYLLGFGALLLILTSAVELLYTKKISWQKGLFDNLLILFILTTAISTVVNSPNKIQALLSYNFGPVMMISFVVIYFYLSRNNKISPEIVRKLLSLSAFILSLVTIVFFFQPFKNINLPTALQFLKTASFTPIGNQLDLAIFLGFFVVLGAAEIITQTPNKKNSLANMVFWVAELVALFLVVYAIFKPAVINNQTQALLMPPLRISWYAAVEVLKNPLSALFGVGVDNYASIFTRVKDFSYNQSPLWQINSFIVSRSTLLHVLTETGIFGLIAFGLLLISMVNLAMKKLNNLTMKLVIGYLLLVILLFPPSLTVWFLFFIVLFSVERSFSSASQPMSFNLAGFLPVYVGLVAVMILIVGSSTFFLARAYQAEAFFKKSLDGIVNNNIKQVYDNQRQAVITNPYIEKFRINFSQTNLLVANNIASKASPQTAAVEEQSGKTAAVKTELTEQDRQTITQAIQAAIAEAKAAVSLNPQKSSSWENLAVIYQNIINVAQGADLWTISAFQRAIVSDPQNPRYRLSLGGIYYALGNWDEANRLFAETINLKPDWPNAYYNLAWSYYQKADYQKAAAVMENVTRLIDPKTSKADYDKAKSELEEFKKKIPKTEETTTSEAGQTPTQLNLPTPAPSIEPKIELPKNASPEAK